MAVLFINVSNGETIALRFPMILGLSIPIIKKVNTSNEIEIPRVIQNISQEIISDQK